MYVLQYNNNNNNNVIVIITQYPSLSPDTRKVCITYYGLRRSLTNGNGDRQNINITAAAARTMRDFESTGHDRHAQKTILQLTQSAYAGRTTLTERTFFSSFENKLYDRNRNQKSNYNQILLTTIICIYLSARFPDGLRDIFISKVCQTFSKLPFLSIRQIKKNLLKKLSLVD